MKYLVAVLFLVSFGVLAQTSRDINYFGSEDPVSNEQVPSDWQQIRADALSYRIIRNVLIQYKDLDCFEKLMVIETYIKAHERNRAKDKGSDGRPSK